MVKFSFIKAKMVKPKHLTLQHENGKISLQKKAKMVKFTEINLATRNW